jgi:hypothetical protein
MTRGRNDRGRNDRDKMYEGKKRLGRNDRVRNERGRSVMPPGGSSNTLNVYFVYSCCFIAFLGVCFVSNSRFNVKKQELNTSETSCTRVGW